MHTLKFTLVFSSILVFTFPSGIFGQSQRTDTVDTPTENVNSKNKQQSNSNDTKTKKPSKAEKKPKPFQWVNKAKNVDPAVKHKTFRSPSLGVDVGYYILLPPEYESDESRRFPVVYYLHGGRPGSEAKDASIGSRINRLRKTEAMTPVIYVFINGGPVSHYNMPDNPDAQGASVFINELIPHIDSTYRTIANRSGRGIEGFSQGGRGTMRLSLRYADLFCSAAAGGGGYETEKRISESGGYESETLRFAEGDNVWDLARDYAQQKPAQVRWMIYVGTKGFNYENNLAYMRFLDSLGIHYEKLIVPDVPHSGGQIYEKAAMKIIQFHADNFKRAGIERVIEVP